MSKNDQTNVEHEVNGGEATEEEARLAAQLDTIGDDPQEEPTEKDAATDDTETADEKETGKEQPDDNDGDDEAAEPDAAPEEPDGVAAAGEQPQESAPATAASRQPKPEPPKDFDAEYQALQKKYDDGDIDDDELTKAQRELAREEGRYTASVTVWEERIKDEALRAAQDFDKVALAWEAEHKDFISNPLRAKAMQEAINSIDEATGRTLSPEALFERAEKIAFEAYQYQPPGKPAAANSGTADAKRKVQDATEARKPGRVPQTLSGSPSAAPIETGRNSTFDELDGKDISDLEDALARMSQEQRDAYLKDAPGAASTSA